MQIQHLEKGREIELPLTAQSCGCFSRAAKVVQNGQAVKQQYPFQIALSEC